jgi:predicted lipoprotein with Yx(FWY)xxD motif
MKTKPLVGLLALAAVGLAACGSGGSNATPAPTNAPAAAVASSNPGSTVSVKVADNKGGKILVAADGHTLYGFTNDADAKSTCYSTCANAWPPVIVDPQWTVGPGLDMGVFSTIQRDDGTLQLVAGKWPLYEYSGDAAPGDTNGQGSGDVWFEVGSDAKLVKGAATAANAAAPTTTATTAYAPSPATMAPAPAPSAPAPAAATAAALALGQTSLGSVLTDAQGRTLYALTQDTNGTPTCTGACAKAWPPALVTGTPTAGPGVTAAVSVVPAPGGGTMLKAGKWPLYRFAGDAAPGDVNGQGSGGVWFAVGADGKLIKN